MTLTQLFTGIAQLVVFVALVYLYCWALLPVLEWNDLEKHKD